MDRKAHQVKTDHGVSELKFASIARADDQVRALLAKASKIGMKEQVIRALRIVYDELRSTPEKLGDPARHTRKQGGVVYNAIVEPIAVHYVVYRIEKAVVLLDVKPLSRFFPEQSP